MVRATDLLLAPMPKKISAKEGAFDTSGKRFIKLEAEDPQCLVAAAKKTGLDWEITASPKAPKSLTGLMIVQDPEADLAPEAYKLEVLPDGIKITASTPMGAFYGACTLAQIVRQSTVNGEQSTEEGSEVAPSPTRPVAHSLPCLSITDAPDFPVRGVMLDISRDKVPTMDTLYHLVNLLSEWKINQLQLYTEHTFRYLAHPTVWEKASPMTGEQIMQLDAYCQAHFIELVPNQNSFGHMERWLKLPKYNSMAEAPEGCDTIWGHFDHPFSLHPADKHVIPFLSGLYDELLPHFSSQMFNVGLDETVDLGRGKSAKECEEKGTGRVYLDFLLQIYELVKQRGKTMQFWGDIIIKHPELIPELPKDAIALEWGYEADHPFEEHGRQFGESGIEFYVCPGTSSWNTLVGRTENAIGNIMNAARNGHASGAVGLLNTDWGDNGHWQPLSVSYLGFMVGAMAAWNTKDDPRRELPMNLSLNAFRDPSGKMGQAFYDLGNIYQCFAKKTSNQSVPWQMLFRDAKDPKWSEGLEPAEFEAMDERLIEIEEIAAGDEMACADSEIVREEFEQSLNVLRLASDVGKWRLGGPKPKHLAETVEQIKMDHECVWLLRNRPGGLADSEKKCKVCDQ